MYYTYYNNELYHYGVKGMKWGKRMARGHAGPGMYLTRKRQLAGDKRDLARLNKGEHLSVGLTKKRQAAYDAKDRKRLESRIAKNEAHFANKQAKKDAKANMTPEQKAERRKKAIKVGVAVAGTALAAYGAYKIGKGIKNKNMQIASEKGKEAAKKYLDANERVFGKVGLDSAGRNTLTSYTRSGSMSQVGGKGISSEALYKTMNQHNDAVRRTARDISKEYTDKAKTDSFIDASKNVYNYYRKKRK